MFVSGKVEVKDTEDTFLWKGVSNKAFTRQFTLADNMEIESAEYLNGMLKIWLETVTPKTTKKKININEPAKRPAGVKTNV